MIDRLYTTLQVITSKDTRGNLTPEEFNELLNSVIEDKYEDYFFELDRALNRQNRGYANNGFAKVPEKLQEKIRHFYKRDVMAKATDTYPAPEDMRYLDAIFYQGVKIALTKNATSFYLQTESTRLRPTLSRPIALEEGRNYTVAPSSITADLDVFYLRKPLKAKWTYNPITEQFNPDANDFQDVDMHPSDEQDILRRLVSKAGINLDDNQLAAYGMNTEQAEFQTNNA